MPARAWLRTGLFGVVLIGLSGASAVAAGEEPRPVAELALFNPTDWKGPLVIEVPTGTVAAPGLLDWARARLELGDQIIPFALRAGRACGSAPSSGIDSAPRAEDLLVFAAALPPGEWTRIRVVAQTEPADRSLAALVRAEGCCTITYPGVKAVIAESSGRLRELEYQGETLLAGQLSVEIAELWAETPYALTGRFGPGPASAADRDAPRVRVNRRATLPWTARLESYSTSAAMTELAFVLDVSGGPSIALTYRVYANGVVDIAADGQPWAGANPWPGHAAAYVLPLTGQSAPLPLLEDRYPLYGFKGYTASVHFTARIHRGRQTGVLELGDEAVNGRWWRRRLVPFAPAEAARVTSLVQAVDEGPIVAVRPMQYALAGEMLRIEYPELAKAAAEKLRLGLNGAGVRTDAAPSGEDGPRMRLELAKPPAAGGIVGDGFVIRSVPRGSGGGVDCSVRARTLNGLYQAASAITAHAARQGPRVPLIARNPIVALRGGGFGGAPIEVDFPYGTEAEWQTTLEHLVTSGMNRFTCLGMWSNWKMPVTYQYMPELRSSSPDAYDESSGARFSEIDAYRGKALRLMEFLHARGAGVWLWMPIGCVPTTFAGQYPEAMAPREHAGRSAKTPCYTHPAYRRYLKAFFREVLEVYPIDGLVLIRDDNGALCTCARCKAYVAAARTRHAAWEQYLVLYDLLRELGFKGDVAVYPYFDAYSPGLDPLLPADLYVVGHGGEPAALVRSASALGLMGDTWLDNLYANFRLPSSARMRRLLSDRGSYWIGGAYCGTELPWEAVGRFGWEPTATPNTLRYEWGVRTFGAAHALEFVRTNAVYEHLWELNARYLPPVAWLALGTDERRRVLADGLASVGSYRQRLAGLKAGVNAAAHARWFGHMELFAPFFEYQLRRVELFARAYDRVWAHRETLQRGEPLPAEARQDVLAAYHEMYAWAGKYDAAMQQAPEGMLTHCRWMTRPYQELVTGFDAALDARLAVPQFAGAMRLHVDALSPGAPFTLTVELHNLGACPWVPELGQVLVLSGAARELGLPENWAYAGEWLAPGDRRVITMTGQAPPNAGEGVLRASMRAPFGPAAGFMSDELNLTWK